MAQFLRPSSDISAAPWTTAPLFSKINEVVRDDSTDIRSTNADPSACVIGLGVGSPPTSGTRTLRYTYARVDTSGNNPTFTVELRQGTTVVQSWSHSVASATYTLATQTVTGTITNYADLNLRFVRSGSGTNTNRRALRVSWAELEVPDPAPNVDPVAFAASHPTWVPDATTNIALQGGGSYDPDSALSLAHRWEQLAGAPGKIDGYLGANPTFVAGSSNPSTPVAGPSLWLDASAITGLANGANVATWADRSGNGHNGSANGTSPTYQTGVVNGLPIVRFGGSGGFLIPTSFTLPQPYSVALVARRTALSMDAVLFYDTEVGSGVHIHGGGTAPYLSTYDGTPRFVDGASEAAIGTFYVITAVVNGVSSWIEVNGDRRSGTLGTRGLVGGWIGWAGASISGYQLTGDIGEIVAYPRVITESERVALTGHLRTKWGV